MPQRIYEPAAYGEASLGGCYWYDSVPDDTRWPSADGTIDVDFAIVGAGYTGLSAALTLAQAGVEVAVLDAHRPGWGASGRNGGFCCIGGAKATGRQIRRRWGEEDLACFRRAERAAIEMVRARISGLGVNADIHSESGELQIAHSQPAFRAMRREAAALAETYGTTAEVLSRAEMIEQGLKLRGAWGGLHLGLGFALNPRKYVLGLAREVVACGARLYADSPVLSTGRTEDGRHLLRLPHGTVRARRLLIATNGYSSDDLPPWMAARYLPMQSSVIVTRPLEDEEIAKQGWSSDLMAYDSRNLLHYFRLMPDRRMLFGMRGAVRWTDAAQDAQRRAVLRHFRHMFPAWRRVDVPWFWSGLVCMARDLVPFAGQIGPDTWAAFAWHGNGVAMGSWTGEQLAKLALGQATEMPGFFGRTPPKFTLGARRRAGLPAALLGDRLPVGG
ncbi:NAD(P)/FAD-dependent oxidoreductase [Paenirhodobacter enshiensis]|uniref:NAD(P)/FAD-dependent oxidoreductase n=1 Tax=Paenirhodobacter enshiensis TaxID=1105367 RepID=UPI003FA2BE3F